MSSDAQTKQHFKVGISNRKRWEQINAAKPRPVKLPKARVNGLSLGVDGKGNPTLTRDGSGGIPPSPWEIILLEHIDEQDRVIAFLRNALAEVRYEN